jgi:hypothetical protein
LLAQPAFAVQLDLSKAGESAFRPTVATNAAGQAVALWERKDEATGLTVIQAAARQTTYTYGPPINLSDSHEAALAVQAAVDQAGNTAAVWLHNDGTGHDLVQATEFTPDGRTILAPVDLSTQPGQPPHVSGADPEVAMNPSGAGVFVWYENDFSTNRTSVRAAALAPGGAITSLGEISTPATIGQQDDESAQVAVDAAGDAIITWAHFGGGTFVIQAAVRPAGAAKFGAPIPVSVPPPAPVQPQEDAFDPQVAFDAAGDAFVVWDKREGATGGQIIQAAELPHGTTTFTTPQNLSAAGQQSSNARLSVDSAGDAVVAFDRSDGTDSVIDTSSLPAGSTSWSTTTLPSSMAGPPDVGVDPAGDTLVVWAGANGRSSDVVLDRRPAGGTFGSESLLSTPGQHANSPRVAVDQAGDAFVVWQRSDGKNTIISTDVPQQPGNGIPAPPNPIGGIPGPPGGGSPGPHPLSLLRLTPGTFSTAGRVVHGHCVAVTAANHTQRHCIRTLRLTVSFKLASAATVAFSVQRAILGRLTRSRCVAATTRNRRAGRCTRLLAVRGRLIRHGHVGTNHFLYTRGGLSPGSYRLLATPSLGGRTAPPIAASFRVVS